MKRKRNRVAEKLGLNTLQFRILGILLKHPAGIWRWQILGQWSKKDYIAISAELTRLKKQGLIDVNARVYRITPKGIIWFTAEQRANEIRSLMP